MMVCTVTWTCVQEGHRRCHPMGDGIDPVSAVSGPDSGLRAVRESVSEICLAI